MMLLFSSARLQLTPTGVVPEASRNTGHIHPCSHSCSLSHIQGLEVSEVSGVGVDEVRELPEHFTAFRAGGLGPDVDECVVGDFDGVVDVFFSGLEVEGVRKGRFQEYSVPCSYLLDLADDLPSRGVHGRERLSALGLDELYEHLCQRPFQSNGVQR